MKKTAYFIIMHGGKKVGLRLWPSDMKKYLFCETTFIKNIDMLEVFNF